MTLKVIVAGIQMDPKIGKKEQNIENMVNHIHSAALKKAQLIIFPECALTGYCFNSLEEAVPVMESIPGPSTDQISSVCKKLGVFVVFGMLERDGDKFFNVAVFIGPQGFIGKHRKLHLPYLGIDRFLNHGNLPISVHQTEIGNIGLGVCYDCNFPEHSRGLAILGADMIILPTNWPEGTEVVPEFIIPARAIENQVFYVAVNRAGEENGFKFIGQSKIMHCYGIPLAACKPFEADIMYAEIEPELSRMKKLEFRPGEFEIDVLNDRRPEFYDSIIRPLQNSSRIR
jgi:5-aminopentanamidase